MTIKHLFLASLSFLLLCSFSISSSEIFYVSIEGLNTSNYKTVKLACSEQESIHIESACVPANIIKLKYTGVNSDAENALRAFLNSNGSFQTIEFLEDFTEENYFDKCSEARVGR